MPQSQIIPAPAGSIPSHRNRISEKNINIVSSLRLPGWSANANLPNLKTKQTPEPESTDLPATS